MNTNNITRRKFIVSNAVLAGSAMISPSFIAVEPSNKKIRIGVVGGGFGRSFQWHEHPDCIVEAVSDLDSQKKKNLRDTTNLSLSYIRLFYR